MPCYRLRISGKISGFICGDLGEHCTECGCVSDVLCDYPVGDGKTCDRSLCEHCAKNVGVDIDYCQGHFEMWRQYRESKGEDDVLANVLPFGKMRQP